MKKKSCFILTCCMYASTITIAQNWLVDGNTTGATAKFNLDKANAGVINIDASGLTAGTYTYTFFIDGRKIETKKMIVSK